MFWQIGVSSKEALRSSIKISKYPHVNRCRRDKRRIDSMPVPFVHAEQDPFHVTQPGLVCSLQDSNALFLAAWNLSDKRNICRFKEAGQRR